MVAQFERSMDQMTRGTRGTHSQRLQATVEALSKLVAEHRDLERCLQETKDTIAELERICC